MKPFVPSFFYSPCSAIEVTDAVNILSSLFQGTGAPACLDASDTDDTGVLDLTDAVYLLNYQFLGGPEPPAPGPAGCGVDPTPDGLDCGNYGS